MKKLAFFTCLSVNLELYTPTQLSPSDLALDILTALNLEEVNS